MNLSPWDADALLELNREYAMEHLAEPGAILVADPTGFPKKGTKSVGVQRQYSGTLGRIDNCQIATFLGYVTADRDRVLVDRRLYLPEESWLADPARCAAAGVPPDLAFATRPAQVIEMIRAARTAGIPFAWFTADEEFGQNPGLGDDLETSRIPYVMAVPKSTPLTDTTGRTERCDERVGRLPRNAWQRRACGIGSKGFRVYDWALIDSADPDHQYLIRRSIDDGELAFYHCYNPNHARVGELVYVAGARWPMTQPLASGLAGLAGLAGLGGEGVQDDPALEGADDGCVGSARVVARGAAFHGAGAGLAFPSPDEPVGEVGEQVVTGPFDPPGGKSPTRPSGGRRRGRS